MNNVQKNEGVIVSDQATINTNALAVGKYAKVTRNHGSENSQNSMKGFPQETNIKSDDLSTLSQLQRLLIALFNESELRDLCFQLQVNYEDLSGQNRTDKIRELILYLYRRQRLNELLVMSSQIRPQTNWPSVSDL